jgi:hypothetical protein
MHAYEISHKKVNQIAKVKKFNFKFGILNF